MGSKRNRRAGVVDLWTKRVRDPDGTTRTVPSSRHGAGMRWRATYVGDQSREHSRSFARKTDAQRWLDEVTASVVTGQYVDPKAGLVRFKDYAERWRKMQVQRPSSRAHIEIMLRLHTYPVLGDRQLTSILPSDIQSWVRGLTLAPATVGVVHGIASTIFKSAIRDRRLAANPCDGTKLPKVQRPQIVPLTTEQVEAVRAELPAELQALVTLAAGTGMRQGECFGLTVDRVRFLERTLTVDRQLITLAGKPPEFGPPKTKRQPPDHPVAPDRRGRVGCASGGVPGGARRVGVHVGGQADHPTNVRTQVASRGQDGGVADWDRVPRAAALLRESADPPRGERQDGPDASGARERRRDAGHLQPAVAGFRRPDARGDRLGAGIYCVRTAYWEARDELITLVPDVGRTSWPVSRILFPTAAA